MLYSINPILIKVKEAIQEKVAQLQVTPKLRIVKTLDHPASLSYIKNKLKLATQLGIDAQVVDATTLSTLDIIKKIEQLYVEGVNGIIVQLPLREGLDERAIIEAIPPEVDVDGFGSRSVYNIFRDGESLLSPCTALGITWILKYYFKNQIEGKKVTIINRSNIVGKPLALMLINQGTTVTVCNSRTQDVVLESANADVIVSAVGKPNFWDETLCGLWGCKHTIADFQIPLLIDVAITHDANGNLCGDCNKSLYEDSNKLALVTPVPGGVGPLTVLALMYNTVSSLVGYPIELDLHKGENYVLF